MWAGATPNESGNSSLSHSTTEHAPPAAPHHPQRKAQSPSSQPSPFLSLFSSWIIVDVVCSVANDAIIGAHGTIHPSRDPHSIVRVLRTRHSPSLNLFGIEMFMGGQTTVGRAAAS